ncbi:hypothetical protein BKA66DRAFT_566782 [Pyrenochaeta sp. MPI-SDFR-AT-0127]|nr:hypothetical protein BKA66DRAFT_566782 [Pyrenochaeta sp. MPI-SDFR-AT-0127]
MSPPYIFRIDEIREAHNAPVAGNITSDWIPPNARGAITRVTGGVSGMWWLCNGSSIATFPLDQLPPGRRPYSTYSVFYSGGFGFWVMEGDATNPSNEATWQPLRFDHDATNGYSSYLCNAAENRTISCRRLDQQWLKMLLPDIYFDTSPVTPHGQYGALKGELAIFLALVAFAMQPEQVPIVLPVMYQNRRWQSYQMPPGRVDRRGVVVYVYSCPPGTREDLKTYENGEYNGEKYYH